MTSIVRHNLDRRMAGRSSGPLLGWTCRLCDLAACGRAEGECPTANAAAAYLRS
jgi:hypothetical protein